MQDALAVERTHRVKCVVVSPELLLALLVVGDGVVIDGRKVTAVADPIPAGSKALRCGVTDDGHLKLVIEHESFDEIQVGEVIPTLTPVYRSEVI